MTRELLYHTPGRWAQVQGLVVEDVAVVTADALALGVQRGQHLGPLPGDPVGATVVERVSVAGHMFERRQDWAVVGDPRGAVGWSVA